MMDRIAEFCSWNQLTYELSEKQTLMMSTPPPSTHEHGLWSTEEKGVLGLPESRGPSPKKVTVDIPFLHLRSLCNKG